MAVETGFHSLVELIAKHDTSQSSEDAALADAVSSRRLDLVELLLANGADIKKVCSSCRSSAHLGNPRRSVSFLIGAPIPYEGGPSPRRLVPRSEPRFALSSSANAHIQNLQLKCSRTNSNCQTLTCLRLARPSPRRS